MPLAALHVLLQLRAARPPLDMCTMLQYFGIRPWIVFDGCELPAKQHESAKRRENRTEAADRVKALIAQKGDKIARYDTEVQKEATAAIKITVEMIERIISALKLANIDFIVAPYEADAQLAYMGRSGFVHAVISEDSDLFVYGCPRVVCKLDKHGYGDMFEITGIIGKDSVLGDKFKLSEAEKVSEEKAKKSVEKVLGQLEEENIVAKVVAGTWVKESDKTDQGVESEKVKEEGSQGSQKLEEAERTDSKSSENRDVSEVFIDDDDGPTAKRARIESKTSVVSTLSGRSTATLSLSTSSTAISAGNGVIIKEDNIMSDTNLHDNADGDAAGGRGLGVTQAREREIGEGSLISKMDVIDLDSQNDVRDSQNVVILSDSDEDDAPQPAKSAVFDLIIAEEEEKAAKKVAARKRKTQERKEAKKREKEKEPQASVAALLDEELGDNEAEDNDEEDGDPTDGKQSKKRQRNAKTAKVPRPLEKKIPTLKFGLAMMQQWNWEMFRIFCVFAGCDYNPHLRVKGLAIATAAKVSVSRSITPSLCGIFYSMTIGH